MDPPRAFCRASRSCMDAGAVFSSTSSKIMSAAFERGRLARKIGLTLRENPYGRMTYEFDEWVNGWIQQDLIMDCLKANEREIVSLN